MVKKSVKDEINVEKKEKTKNKSKKKFIIILIIALIIVSGGITSYFIFLKNDDSIKIDGKKIDTKDIKIYLSEDKKSLSNSVYEVLGLLIQEYKIYENKVGEATKCSAGNYKLCYKIVVEDDTSIYVYGKTDKTVDLIEYVSNLNDSIKYFDTCSNTVTENITGNFYHDVADEFLAKIDMNMDKGLSFVSSNVRLDWTYNDKKDKLKIVMSFVDYDQDTFIATDEYKEQYKNYVTYYGNEEASKMIDSTTELLSVDYNNDTKLSDVKIKYNLENLTKVKCAERAHMFGKNVIRREKKHIGSVDLECVDNGNTIYYAKVDNLGQIKEEEVESNTTYFDSNRNKQNVTLETLKQNEVKEYKNSCSKLNYKDVLRNPEQFEGKKVQWFGEVVQVVGFGTYRVNVNCTKYHYISGYSCPDTIYVEYSGDSRLIEDDMVYIYGTMDGTKTYTTVMGASVTVPKVNAKYVDLK